MDLTEKPKKPKKDRKEYIKEYNTTYYETHKEEILMQKKMSRQEQQDADLKEELKRWKEDKLNDPHAFEPFYHDNLLNKKK